MQDSTARQLLALNSQFYQTFAVQFSATRQRIQPGMLRLLRAGRLGKRILDLGCGNGELARRLVEAHHQGSYTGLDFSAGLLEHARQAQAAIVLAPPSEINGGLHVEFFQQDLTQASWQVNLPVVAYDTVLALAVMHHLPGQALRNAFLAHVRTYLAPEGVFIHSNWQFLNSPRLAARLQPWEKAGINPAEVDPGDFLLDWRSGGSGLRYVHHFQPAELEQLAGENGFEVIESFHSDGETGNLGFYQLWRVKQ